MIYSYIHMSSVIECGICTHTYILHICPHYCCIISSTGTTFLYGHVIIYSSPTVTKFGERAFSVAGLSVWNSLPADIRHITDTSVFKRHIKTHFCNLYFNS